MNIKQQIKERIEWLLENVNDLRALDELVGPEGFEVEKARVSSGGCYIDIDTPSRGDVLEILRRVNRVKLGKWIKEKVPGQAAISYISELKINGKKIRLWAAEPPGSCRIVEEQIEIPAQPARKETVKRLICTPEKEEVI